MAKKSFAAQIDETAARAGASAQVEPAAQPAEGIEFSKYTVPLRTDQIAAMKRLIAQTTIDYNVELSRAVLVRYGLDLVLAAAGDDMGRLLQQLADLERRELEMNANRVHSISVGLDRFLPE